MGLHFWLRLLLASLNLAFAYAGLELFGFNAGGHHLVNLAFHIANTLLLFIVLKQMTRAVWRSAFVAALFAIHPLHVESVAWVTERKDVLSTFFWILTMWAYVRFVGRPKIINCLLMPLFLLVVLGMWFWQDWRGVIAMRNVSQENRPYVLWTRIGLVIFFGVLAFLVFHV